MGNYRYTARTEDGKTVRGQMNASSEIAVYRKLLTQQQYLVNCRSLDKDGKQKRIKPRELSEFNRQLGTLLRSGVSLVRALAIIVDDEGVKTAQRVIYQDVLKEIRKGTHLSDAMEQQGESFPPLMVEMLRSAESSGSLDKTALRLAAHYEKEYRLTSKVSSAMAYPMILGVLIVAVVAILMSYVLPQFEDLFSLMEELPITTRILYAVSGFMVQYWYVIFGVLGLLIVFGSILLNTPQSRIQIDKALLKLPMVGQLLKTIYTARFARSLSSLYSAGLPIVVAMQIARKTIGNLYIDDQFTAAIAQVRSGENLSAALRAIDGFSKKMASSIMVGEETGSLDSMLDSMADALDYEAELAIGKLITLVEPLMIIIMAVIVGFIMLAIITPIYGSYNSIGSYSATGGY